MGGVGCLKSRCAGDRLCAEPGEAGHMGQRVPAWKLWRMSETKTRRWYLPSTSEARPDWLSLLVLKLHEALRHRGSRGIVEGVLSLTWKNFLEE